MKAGNFNSKTLIKPLIAAAKLRRQAEVMGGLERVVRDADQRIREVTDKWLVDEREAAKFSDFSVAALVKWRHEGRGPRYIRVGRSIRYRISDLLSWIDSHAVGQPTSS